MKTGDLRNRAGVLLFKFPDTTCKWFTGTLSAEILGEEILSTKPSAQHIYNMDTQKWFDLNRVLGSSLVLYESLEELYQHENIKEIDRYANKFIV